MPVINYDLPTRREDYIFRVGLKASEEQGASPASRLVVSLVINADARVLRDLESFYNTEISRLPGDYAADFVPDLASLL